MFAYILRRLLLMIPTLLGIMVINFIVIQFAPGGPIEQLVAEMSGNSADATAAFAGQEGDMKPAADATQTTALDNTSGVFDLYSSGNKKSGS